MKSFLQTVKTTYDATSRVYRFNKTVVILSLLAYIVSALQSNLSVYASKFIVDQLTLQNLNLLMGGIALLILFQLLRVGLDSYAQLKSRKMSLEFSIQCENQLIDLVADTDLIEKEHPRFKGDFSYWSYSNSKYYDTYSIAISLVKQIVLAALSLFYLLHSYWVTALLALLVGTLRGIYDLRAVRQRVEIDEQLIRITRSHHYYYDLLTTSETQKEMMLFQLYPHFRKRWMDKKTEWAKLQIKLDKINHQRIFRGELLSIVNTGLVSVITAYLIYKGSLSIGDYVAITMALSMTENNISSMFSSFSRLKEFCTHIEKLKLIEGSTQVAVSAEKQTQAEPFIFEHDIQIRELTFRYPNQDKPAIAGINAQIKKGEVVAILGENGSGKSTLIKLLLGLYRTHDDSILYDGVSLKHIDRFQMWNKSSAIFQDFIRYMTQVRDNIAAGHIDDIDNSEKLNRMLARVGLSDTFKHGLDNRLGFLEDDAVNLSGGQWQRLALSRVFVRDEDELVVFDEPTAALDPLSEVRLMNDILGHFKGKTVLLISHRVGVARNADRIIVMERGRIAETGTHEELLARQGLYSEMWNQQKQWYD
ncbi:ATP-binding cassette domain-containing protein [Paenibacillus lutrae]|uniref:ATP-binding cassette domain-containing protein n=1 Tax=Paenibacillus lutrae TaxID=2078573 RepID=A0A7X3FF94_9BACL|nr:ATP-binding cassette domain-containing protein [Paenibacillus lutrae]MVO98602.1 ATP-binding cassette domain-containing protein [Paenibacillus lutrae]